MSPTGRIPVRDGEKGQAARPQFSSGGWSMRRDPGIPFAPLAGRRCRQADEGQSPRPYADDRSPNTVGMSSDTVGWMCTAR
ncbi:hypothetical protein CN163_31700, partial [Sinorhizobium meliloti]